MAETNLAWLKIFIEEQRRACSWVRLAVGTTAFSKVAKKGKPVNDEGVCETLHEKPGITVCPGSKCFENAQDHKGYVRIRFVQGIGVLKESLAVLSKFLEDDFEAVPTVGKS